MNTAPVAAPPMVKPWYREPWPWFLMAGPFLAVVGCAITIYLAYTQFGNQPIQEGVVKRGLVIEQVDAVAAPPATVGVR
ncbi:FixH family protein [Achromobacter xylosoxidans]|uniref:FixH family protein n=1 Tax=Alcaligenes xylosoxydans xylosoxydans TaxID=85698 RepID=UPI001EEEFFF4|nr:FixH family protein [Achromobacter xylosoxidans]